MKIGILGGTFNPIHVGHLAIAETALEKMGLNKIFFVPCHTPPHKEDKSLTAPSHRYNMVKLAIDENPRFEISDFEIQKKDKSYSIDTVKHFKNVFPKSELFFIIGYDMLDGLKQWKSIDEILKLASFIVINRPEYKKKENGIPYHTITMPGLDISSS
ncbi:MAG: nicotinate (nicotinamide) nucleotide adenylyltransferase, partial [Omnitrophica WOR_2 bacterium GWA2_47_8]